MGSLFVLLSVVMWIAGLGKDADGSLTLMKMAFAGLGATMLPMLPVSLENASEYVLSVVLHRFPMAVVELLVAN